MMSVIITLGSIVLAFLALYLTVTKILFPRIERANERKEYLRAYREDIHFGRHTGYFFTMQRLRDAGKVRDGSRLPLDPGLPRRFRRWCPILRHLSDDPRLDPKLTETLQRGDEAHVNYLFALYLAQKCLARKDETDFQLARRAIETQDRLLQAVIKELELVCQAPAPEAPAAPAAGQGLPEGVYI